MCVIHCPGDSCDSNQIEATIPRPIIPLFIFSLLQKSNLLCPAMGGGCSKTGEADVATPITDPSIGEFIIYNSGTCGSAKATFSFGGSYDETTLKVTHGPETYTLGKFEAKRVRTKVGNKLLIDGFKEGEGPPMAGPMVADKKANEEWLRHVSIPFDDSAMGDICDSEGFAPPEHVFKILQ